jgi:hypothetical protein
VRRLLFEPIALVLALAPGLDVLCAEILAPAKLEMPWSAGPSVGRDGAGSLLPWCLSHLPSPLLSPCLGALLPCCLPLPSLLDSSLHYFPQELNRC